MAVTVTSNLTLVNAADSTTGWSGGTLYSGFQREGSGCLGTQASNGSAHLYFTLGTATDLSNHTIFVWLKSGNPTPQSTGGYRIVIGDGTNRVAFYVGGSDNAGFFAESWSCFKLNTANLPANFATLAGTRASLNTASILTIGGGWNYASKAVGNTDNVFIDVMRYVPNGTPALVVGGGTSGDRGTFSQLATQDSSTTNAWGICRNLLAGSNAFQLNFGVDFGNGGTATSYFSDTDGQLFLNGTSMASGAMDVAVLSNGTGTNSFELQNFTVVSIGQPANWYMSGSTIDTLQLIDNAFSNAGTFTFGPSGSNKLIDGTSFTNCGKVTPSGSTFRNVTFLNAKDDAITIDDPTYFDVQDSTFDNPTNHGVEITTAATYSFSGLTFVNTDGVANFDIENTTAGAVLIQAVDGSNPTSFENTGGGSVTIQNLTSVTLTGLVSGSEVRVYEQDTTTEIAGEESVLSTFNFSDNAGNIVDIRVFAIEYEPFNILDFEIPINDTSIPVDQRFDRNYSNP